MKNKRVSHRRGPGIIAGLVVLLLFLYQDNWNWSDSKLVFDAVPIGLVWHMGLSIAASAIWLLASKIAWPLDDQANAE